MSTKITNWKIASEAWRDFCTEAHPELRYSGNGNSWIHFQRTHGKRLRELDIIRQTGPRRPMIVDTDRFEEVVFALLTLGEVPDEDTTAA
ncbi:hypothetical protein [Paraburkholderia youngii]|uniref:hypothetical protein n=1 Tax=Paraburkholderia youngii TaxID=2782701 RepID=UPI003D1EF7C8